MVKESLSRGMLRVAMYGCLLCGGIPLAAQTQEYLRLKYGRPIWAMACTRIR